MNIIQNHNSKSYETMQPQYNHAQTPDNNDNPKDKHANTHFTKKQDHKQTTQHHMKPCAHTR